MFGLLNPFALWLAPLLAAPLVIHFLGRSQPKLRDFPSLMPVKGLLAQAMKRHRLKNWLQLILRTLALLFLLLAATNPVWRSSKGFAPPNSAGMLIHNGAYAASPANNGKTILDAEERMQRGLDSLTSGHCRTLPVLRDAPGREPVARFGSYSEALFQLLQHPENPNSFHLHVPVFDWRDLENSEEVLRSALEQNPHLRVVLTEYPEAREHLAPFSDFKMIFPSDNVAAFRASSSVSTKTQVLWTPQGGSLRDIQTQKDSVEILAPLSQAGWVNGALSLPSSMMEAFAYPSATISAHIPPSSTLCHVGNTFASLASLGRGGLRLQVKSFPDAHSLEAEHCDFLYLADPKESDASLLGRAAEISRSGGKVILGVGKNTDVALLNRSLLEPLGVGHLSELKQGESMPVKTRPAALSGLGAKAISTWGEPGILKSHIRLQPDTGTRVLLVAGDDPILVQRKTGKRSLLLWTTDVDDPTWTDLGLGPWVALVHQAFISGTWTSGIGMQSVASDSTFVIAAEESDVVRVVDPSGTTAKISKDAEGWRAGPFDRLGLYRIEHTRENRVDTSWLSVHLDQEHLSADDGAKDRFLAALGDSRKQVAVREAGDGWRFLYGGFRLRLSMLILAALLLLLEGVVSLRLRPEPLADGRN